MTNGTNKFTVCDTSKAAEALGGSGFYVSVMTMESIARMPDPRSQLQNTKVPLLLMRGQCDNQKWGFQTEYLGLFPQHQLAVIPGAGHVISLEQPVLYLKTIQDFLKKTKRADNHLLYYAFTIPLHSFTSISAGRWGNYANFVG